MLTTTCDLFVLHIVVCLWESYLRLLSYISCLLHGFPGLFLVQEQGRTLISLHTEVLSQILVHLDYSSVLAAGLTCKTLHSATKSRQFWCSFIAKLQMKHGISPPEEELDDYTTNELEKWVGRRSQVQDVWAGSTQPRFRSRILNPRPNIPYPTPSHWILVPGGRWLLIAYTTGAMYAYDLDDANPVPRTLYDHSEFDREIPGGTRDVDYAFWIDRSKPRLSFRIAGSMGERRTSRTFIYQVDLVGHGAGATLVAKLCASFRVSQPGKRYPLFALSDHYVVELWNDPGECMLPNVNKEIKVYHYCEAPVGKPREYSLIKPIVHRFKGIFCTLVGFIDKNIFVVHATSPDMLYLFEIDGSTSLNSVKLLHTVETLRYDRSDILSFPGMSESRLVVLGPQKLDGFVIPHDKAIPPTVIQLASYNSAWYRANCHVLGISASLFFDCKNDTCGIATQKWDSTLPARSIPLLFNQTPHLLDRFVGFDEGTGRLVFVNWKHTVQIINVI